MRKVLDALEQAHSENSNRFHAVPTLGPMQMITEYARRALVNRHIGFLEDGYTPVFRSAPRSYHGGRISCMTHVGGQSVLLGSSKNLDLTVFDCQAQRTSQQLPLLMFDDSDGNIDANVKWAHYDPENHLLTAGMITNKPFTSRTNFYRFCYDPHARHYAKLKPLGKLDSSTCPRLPHALVTEHFIVCAMDWFELSKCFLVYFCDRSTGMFINPVKDVAFNFGHLAYNELTGEIVLANKTSIEVFTERMDWKYSINKASVMTTIDANGNYLSRPSRYNNYYLLSADGNYEECVAREADNHVAFSTSIPPVILPNNDLVFITDSDVVPERSYLEIYQPVHKKTPIPAAP